MADKAHLQTDIKLEQMEKRLSAIYSASQRKIQSKMLEFAKSIEPETSELLKAIKKAKTEEEKSKAKKAYLQYFKKEVVKSKAFKNLSAEIALDLFDTNTEATDYINSQTPEIYALNYNWINEQLAKDIPDFVSQSITTEEADRYGDLTKQTVSKSKDTRWNENNLKKSIVVGASLSMERDRIMERGAKITIQKNLNSAIMHCNGMGTDAETRARLDGMFRAEDMGVDIGKVWMATLDNRTRDSHAQLDGNSVGLYDRFDNGLDRPRDPDGEPAEICNCRCTLQYDVGQKKGKTRAARHGDVTGSYKKSSSYTNTYSEEVKHMTYARWKRWRKTR